MPVIFITDAFIFLLVFMVLAFVLYARKHEHLSAPWKDVARRPIAMSAAIFLAVYVVIGLIDSLHFHPKLEDTKSDKTIYSTEILSVLDIVLNDLRQNTERTYSAPLASYAFAKEMIELPDGKQTRDYPRLKYGGAHLDDPESEGSSDIAKRLVSGLISGLLISLMLIFSVIFQLKKKPEEPFKVTLQKCIKDELDIPWYAIFITLTFITLVICCVYSLAQHYHVFGTDKVGQDVLYQSLKSIRTGLVIGTLTTLVMLPFAIMMGLMAGYFRGWIDDVIQYLYTTLNSIPSVLLIAASILLLQVYISNHEADFTSLEQRADLRLLFLCIILGITSWTGLCRLLRAETLKLREVDYVQAAQAFGVGNITIMLRHLLPNVMHIVMISIVLDFSGLVLAEAVLSYINIGVDPSMYSWGNMINSARLEIARDPVVWWSLAAAFIFMFILVLAANLFSDAVRDAFDPRLRGDI
ncbi:MAG: ABC transporter permease [Proteobacteria bacterium]|nr:ABC transporter permease [Pseudomonadota bacterium]NOG61652.1 ABC transporter permease [Pseudomonadota bacterium]